jgi:uncharacterized membrane protein YeaQ/YmgE (transglycosylase-associated protein family)
MSGIGWLLAIIVGIAAGWLAEKIMRREHGLLTNLIVGLVGALIGKFLLNMMGVAYAGILPSLGAAVLGAVILLAILGFFHRRRGALN